MSYHAGFVGQGIEIMDLLQKDIDKTRNPRILIPIMHLYLERIFDLVLTKYWDESSNVMGEKSGYSEKLKILFARNLIDKERFETLRAINSIRNEFAHSFTPNNKKIQKLTLKIKGHGFTPKRHWIERYIAGCIDSMSVLCTFLEEK